MLRRYTMGDVGAVFEAVSESFVALRLWMPWCHAGYSIQDTESWIRAQVDRLAQPERCEESFAICGPDGRLLGTCGLNQIDAANARANLGYWVRSSATGQGVATAAVRHLRTWAFAETSLVRLEVLVAEGNQASRRVAQRSGAVYEGTLRRRVALHGVMHDALMFAFIRPGA